MNLEFLRPLYDGPEPAHGPGYVSVYLDTSPDEATSAEVALRWRAASGQLAAEGADEATLDAVAGQVNERPPPAPGLCVLAQAGTIRLVRPLDWRPRDEVSRYAPLPHVEPLLRQLASTVPHVRVNAARDGARLLACPAGTGPGAEITVEGEPWPVHKVSRGGWSEYRLTHSAEETWHENAKRTAEATARAAADLRAVFVLVGGNERERSAVIDALPTAVADVAVTVDREADPGSPSFSAVAEAESARRTAGAARARLDDFRSQMSRDDPAERRAVEGLAATLTALRTGLASSVLLGAQPPDGQPVWIGPGLADAAASARELDGPGDAAAVPDRADAAVARAACGTSAELFFLDEDDELPAGGIGALLRAPAAAV